MPTFTTAEYERRIAETRDRMRSEGIDTLLVTDPANIYYLTGYDGWSFYVTQATVLSLHRKNPLWIGREMDVNAAKQTTWLDDSDIYGYTDEYVQSPADKHPMDYVASVLGEHGLDQGTVGVEMGAYYFTARAYRRLQQNLADQELADATLLVNYVRRVKSDAEISEMRKATRIIEKTMEVALDALEPGVRECDVVAQIYQALIGGTEDFGGDYPAAVPLMPTGEGTNTPHLTWSDRRLEEGEPVILELAGCRNRYHSPLARTAYLGEPRASFERVVDATKEGLDAAIAAVEPGRTCEDVWTAYRDVIGEYGLEKNSRLGYTVGIGYPPDWGEHTSSFRAGDETVLSPNMTFHMIAGMWEDDYGVEISETVRVTDDGVEVFSEFPRDLAVK